MVPQWWIFRVQMNVDMKRCWGLLMRRKGEGMWWLGGMVGRPWLRPKCGSGLEGVSDGEMLEYWHWSGEVVGKMAAVVSLWSLVLSTFCLRFRMVFLNVLLWQPRYVLSPLLLVDPDLLANLLPPAPLVAIVGLANVPLDGDSLVVGVALGHNIKLHINAVHGELAETHRILIANILTLGLVDGVK